MSLGFFVRIVSSCTHTMVLGGVVMVLVLPHVVCNTTPSDRLGLYWYQPLTPWRRLQVGDRVMVAPTAPMQATLHQVAPTLDPSLPWMKTVAAVAGDTVCMDDESVIINGVWRAARSLLHDAPIPVPQGCATIAPDTYFLLNDHPRSFDSRYVGAVPRAVLFGTAMPLYTWRAHE